MSRRPNTPSPAPGTPRTPGTAGTPGTAAPRALVIRAAISDAASVIGLSVIAAMAVGKGAGQILTFLACFVPALAVAWLASRAWRNPGAIKPVGLGVWAATAMVGLAIIAVSEGTSPAWPMITVVVGFLAVFMLGWRGLAGAAARQQR